MPLPVGPGGAGAAAGAAPAAPQAPVARPAPQPGVGAGGTTFERFAGQALAVLQGASAGQVRPPDLESLARSLGAAAQAGVAIPLSPEARKLLAALASGADARVVFAKALEAGLPPEVLALLDAGLTGLIPPDVQESLATALAPLATPADAGTAADARDASLARTPDGAERAARAGPGDGERALARAEKAPAQVPAGALAQHLPRLERVDRVLGRQLEAAALAAATGAAAGPDEPRRSLRAFDHLLHQDPVNAAALVAGLFQPRPPDEADGARSRRDGAGGGAHELLEAVRSLDHAGLKALALDRASVRLAELRGRLRDDPTAAADLLRTRENAALLLASDPAGIAAFARSHPDLFPPGSARNALGELLRGGDAATRRALLATFGHVLLPAGAADRAAALAHAAGYLAGAGAAAAARSAEGPARDRLPVARLAATVSAARALLAALARPGRAEAADGALAILGDGAPALDSALAQADGEHSRREPGDLLEAVRRDLLAVFAARGAALLGVVRESFAGARSPGSPGIPGA